MDTSDTMAIGELARRTGLTPEGIRFYERVGLLPPPDRVGGRRRYTADDAERLVAIRLCRAAGFTVEEVRRILQRTGEWRPVVRTKLAQIEHQMMLLAAVRDALQEALDCDHDDPMTCPYFRARLRSVDPIAPEADVRTGRWHDEPDAGAHHGHHADGHHSDGPEADGSRPSPTVDGEARPVRPGTGAGAASGRRRNRRPARPPRPSPPDR